VKRKHLFAILTTLIVGASIAASAIAMSGTTYSWEKTFEVTEPKIECEIEIGECTVIGCPVKIWVMLKLDDCGDCWSVCKDRWDDKSDDDWDDVWDDWTRKCRCHINGTYAVTLHWWNETQEDWQHLMDLQADTNRTLTCWKHVKRYTFTPTSVGEYKVVVTFTTETVDYTFTSND
jgi:hypothetical protein